MLCNMSVQSPITLYYIPQTTTPNNKVWRKSVETNLNMHATHLWQSFFLIGSSLGWQKWKSLKNYNTNPKTTTLKNLVKLSWTLLVNSGGYELSARHVYNIQFFMGSNPITLEQQK